MNIKEKYPDLYDCCFDFSIGEGWYPLVDFLSGEIDYKIKKNKKDLEIAREQVAKNPKSFYALRLPKLEETEEAFKDNPVKVLQVKEKFGGLRFYVSCATDEMYHWISFAENMSFTICEKCGRPGEERGRGWIKTLCEDCNRLDL